MTLILERARLGHNFVRLSSRGEAVSFLLMSVKTVRRRHWKTTGIRVQLALPAPLTEPVPHNTESLHSVTLPVTPECRYVSMKVAFTLRREVSRVQSQHGFLPSVLIGARQSLIQEGNG